MTLNTTIVKKPYNGDGSTIVFPIPFVFWDDDDVQAILTDANGDDTTWVRGSNYTITGGLGLTGTLTVITTPNDYTPAVGEKLTILSNLSDIQNENLPAGGPFPSASVEQALDKIVRRIQQKANLLVRALKLSATSAYSDLSVPDPVSGKVLRWKTDLTGLENSTATEGGALTLPLPVVDGGTGAADASTARTNLGLADTAVTVALTHYFHGGL